MTTGPCACGARFTTRGAQFAGGPYTTCPLCGAAMAADAVEVALPFPEAAEVMRRAYREACLDLAGRLAFEVRAAKAAGELAWEHAETALDRLTAPDATPHAWIFWTRWPLALSALADDALDERPSGNFDWQPPDPQSAARAVARHDVLCALGAIMGPFME